MGRVQRRTWIINGGLVLLVVVLAGVAFGSVGSSPEEEEEIRTVAVERGSVVATVSASGQLVAPTDLVLDFAAGGRVVEIRVEPGDVVTEGEVLARLDDADAIAQRESAEAGVEAAQAGLDRVLNRLTPAQRALGRAQLASARSQVRGAEIAVARAEAVAQANAALYQQQVDAARAQVERLGADQQDQVAAARAGLTAAESALNRLLEGQTPGQRAVGDAQIEQAEAAVEAAEVAASEAEDVAEANAEAYDTQVEVAEDALDAAEAQLAGAEDLLATLEAEAEACDPDATPDECDELEEAVAQQQALVIQYEAAVRQAESGLASAEAARTQGRARDDQAVAVAEAQLEQAELALEVIEAQVAASREGPTAAEVAQAEAQVEAARAQLEQALRGVDDAPLASAEANRRAGLARDAQATDAARAQLDQAQRALDLARAQVDANQEPPVQAEIAAAEAQLQQASAALDQANRLVEETSLRAPVAGTVAEVNAEVGELVGAGAVPGGQGFLRLTDVGDLLVEAQFSEADAIRIVVGRSASVEVNALGDELLRGRVVRIDPTATVVNDLVTYGVRVAVADLPAVVRPGQTVTVDVIVDEVDDTLFVPSSALERVGDETYVTVVDEMGEPSRRRVREGIQGDGTTEILAGLREGERVAVVGGGYVPPTNIMGA